MQNNYTPKLPESLSEQALRKLRTIFEEDKQAYSRELNIIAIALDGDKAINECDNLKINETVPV